LPKKTVPSITGANRYPGEDCDGNNTCISTSPTTGTCSKSGKCLGDNSTNTCTSTQSCIAGYYCGSDLKCAAQKGSGVACAVSSECQNSLVCWDKTCQKSWYTAAVNTDVSTHTDFQPFSYLCASGQTLGSTSGVCVSFSNAGTPDKTTLLVACTPGKDKCTYNTGVTATPTIQEECTCGFNPTGVAYCPKGHDVDSDKWTSYYQSLAAQYDNECHVAHRTNCYLTEEKALTTTNNLRFVTQDNHLFYGSDSCAEVVLSSSSLKLSILSIIGILFMIFF